MLRYRQRNARNRLWFDESLIRLSEEQIDRLDQVERRNELLAECLARLGRMDRDLLERRYMDGEDVARLADRLGAPVSTIYKRLARIRENLQQCVKRGLLNQEGTR